MRSFLCDSCNEVEINMNEYTLYKDQLKKR